MNRIAEEFAKYFERWEITLPADAIKDRRPGRVQSQGWTVQYQFGSYEQDEFLDFYATHRMTNDRHVRIYASGEIEPLSAYLDFIIYPKDASEEQKKQVDREYRKYNEQVEEELKRKGFL
jgi:hypothetical protein